jgi:NAD(P)-dependent dehydrogenase (short-subunit alcohol dehydrogenase family)
MARTLITGCSTGFGRAAAIELTKRGHQVVATSRRVDALEGLDVDARLELDVTDEASVRAAVDAAGTVDALVNNAGIVIGGPVELVPVAEVQRLFETNVFGPLRMMQAVLPQMRARGRGTIVNVSSVNGRVSAPLSGFYAATKYALEAMSEALHYEAEHFGIHTVIIEPGYFRTNLSDSRLDYGVDTAPYDELKRQADQMAAKIGRDAAPGPEAVACAIADAIEADPPPLRVPVGTDAEMVLAARASMDDAAFEAAMRAVLGLEW